MIAFTQRGPRSPIRLFPASVLAALTLLVAGCEWFVDPPPPCPRISILSQARLLTLYRDGPGRDLSDVTFDVSILDVAMRCDYDLGDEGGVIDVEFVILLEAQRGPAAETDSVTVPVFVAIADPDRDIVAKNVFQTTVRFADGAVRAQATEEIEERIPFAQGEYGPGYETFVGLQLTPAQLEDARRLDAR